MLIWNTYPEITRTSCTTYTNYP